MDANTPAEIDTKIQQETEEMKQYIQSTFDRLLVIADDHFTN